MPNLTVEEKVAVEASKDVKFCYLSARNVVLLIFFSSPYFRSKSLCPQSLPGGQIGLTEEQHKLSICIPRLVSAPK